MISRRLGCAAIVLGTIGLCAGAASAYPGGTPGYQTDAAPFCASCHSSRSEAALAGAPGERASKELAANKHLAQIEKGEGGYADLSAADRATLIQQIQALDEATTIEMTAPRTVKAGETFTVTVDLTGGAGPVVAVALLDAAHRWLARPAPGAGWQVVEPPNVIGQDFKEQTGWLHRRPAAMGRNLSYVNITGIASDASKREWGRAQVVFTLRAPDERGTHPLAAVYWYGTEKGMPLGHEVDPIRGKIPRGGFTGASGRLLFTPVKQIQVR